MSSSHANKGFDEAIHAFKNDKSFIAVATYLYGVDWKEKLKVVDSEEQHNNEESNSANDNDEKAMRQILLEEMIMIHFDLNP